MSRKLRRAYGFIRTSMEELGLHNLDISHGDVLFQLYTRGEMTMKELANAIHRDKSTLTALIKKMESQQLVRRIREKTDRRSFQVSLTEKGESYRRDFMNISQGVIKEIYGDMNEDDQRQLVNLLSQLKDL